jgi:hypothetical protein
MLSSLWVAWVFLGTAMALQKAVEYILQHEKFSGPRGFKTAHHCFRSLLEVMVDLKELLEASGSEGSEPDTESEDDEDDDEDDDEADESDEVCSYFFLLIS